MVTTLISPHSIKPVNKSKIDKVRSRKKVLKAELLVLENKIQGIKDELQQCAQEEFLLTQKQLF